VIAALPTWKDTSFARTFLEARAHLKEVGAPHPGVSALRVARVANNTWGVLLLAQRVEVSRRYLLVGSRQRLGRLVWNLGSRLQQDSTVLVRNVGLQLMSQGAMDLGEETESARVEAVLEQAVDMLTVSDGAVLERWPLPSLWEEVAEARARDEWAHWREFAGVSSAPAGGEPPLRP
jgi:hypothetical protein